MLNEGFETLNIENGYDDDEYQSAEDTNNCGVEEIVFPSTLKEIGAYMFYDYPHLRVVWVRDGCNIDIRNCVT